MLSLISRPVILGDTFMSVRIRRWVSLCLSLCLCGLCLVTGAASAESGKLPTGVSNPGDIVFQRLQAAQDTKLTLSLDSERALNTQQRQIDGVTIFDITLLLAFFLAIAMLKEPGLRWLRYATYFFGICVWASLLVYVGYGQSLAGLEPAQCDVLIKRLALLTLVSIGLVFTLAAKEFFPQSRWMNWLFVWPVTQFLLLCASWIDLAFAFQIAERMQVPGAWLLVFFLLTHAIRDPAEFRKMSGQSAFFVLLALGVALAASKTAIYVGGGALLNSLSHLNSATELLLLGLGPLTMTLLVYFLLVRKVHQRRNHLQSALHHTQASLDVEQQRLERQLKFNVMLSHELKNPLMASQMALSNLQRQLEPGGLSTQSADTIQQSLQTIDEIIERCAEIDAYESASVPLNLSRFSVADLLAAVKAMHKNERIYIVTRRVDDGLLLTSDMHYPRVILSNLLTNALKYSEPDTLVELLLTMVKDEDGTQLAFSISNTLGLAGAPDPAQVFERYYRSEGARQQPGTGQGLWLAQSMAQALGSRISLKVDGKAVTFGFSLQTQ